MANSSIKWKLLYTAVSELKQYMTKKYDELNGSINDETFDAVVEQLYNTLENIENV